MDKNLTSYSLQTKSIPKDKYSENCYSSKKVFKSVAPGGQTRAAAYKPENFTK